MSSAHRATYRPLKNRRGLKGLVGMAAGQALCLLCPFSGQTGPREGPGGPSSLHLILLWERSQRKGVTLRQIVSAGC